MINAFCRQRKWDSIGPRPPPACAGHLYVVSLNVNALAAGGFVSSLGVLLLLPLAVKTANKTSALIHAKAIAAIVYREMLS
jgi:hypothetical protein